MWFDINVSVWFYHYVKIKTNTIKKKRKAGRKEVRKEGRRSHETGYGGKKAKKKDFLGPLPLTLVTLEKERHGWIGE